MKKTKNIILSSSKDRLVNDLLIILLLKLVLIFILWKLFFSSEHRVKVDNVMQEKKILEKEYDYGRFGS